MDAPSLQPGTPLDGHWDLSRADGTTPAVPELCFADVAMIIDTLVHADDLAGRAVEALGHGDVTRAIGDFEWSLKFHVQAAIRSAERSIAAHREGQKAQVNTLMAQADLLFWHLPGRARIAATLLRAAVAGTDAPDPAESLRFIAEGALRYPEARAVLSAEALERLTIAVRAAFTLPPPRFDLCITRVDPAPPQPDAGHAAHKRPSVTPAVLSGREREVICLIAEGLTNRGIGFQLGVKPITINTFVTRIFGKLGVDNRAAAAAYAVRQGLCNG
jgi:DNA-binding NarL/FixJ family response regulator